MTTTYPILTFDSRAAAQAHIAVLDDCTYYLGHGECDRPHYTARKMRGEDHYYVHAAYSYYAGTFHAKQNGPLLDY